MILEIQTPLRVKCVVRAKCKGKVIHLLDLDEGMSLTNAINYDFQVKVLENMRLGGKPEDYTWVLYHTDNTISVFENNSFKFDKNAPKDLEFVAEMESLYGSSAFN